MQLNKYHKICMIVVYNESMTYFESLVLSLTLYSKDLYTNLDSGAINNYLLLIV